MRAARSVILALLVVISFAALQTALFFYQFTPRIEQANAQLYDLAVENSKRSQYYGLARQVAGLIESAKENDSPAPALAVAWKEFASQFAVAPHDAVDGFMRELPKLAADSRSDSDAIDKLAARLERLQLIYSDSYKDSLDEFRDPPAYLWPMASIVAKWSGYRQAVSMNRALYLAQSGEIGTARVILAGLNASVEDPDLLAKIYYTLGRLQFELFRGTPEAEHYTQSVEYLRQSLVVDPDLQLAQRLLDFLLSLPQAAAAPQTADGRPETPSEGEGAAISAERRIF
ncbi:MAG: hypothetical protein ACE5KS_01725 [Woeseiaceae bacterium]